MTTSSTSRGATPMRWSRPGWCRATGWRCRTIAPGLCQAPPHAGVGVFRRRLGARTLLPLGQRRALAGTLLPCSGFYSPLTVVQAGYEIDNRLAPRDDCPGCLLAPPPFMWRGHFRPTTWGKGAVVSRTAPCLGWKMGCTTRLGGCSYLPSPHFVHTQCLWDFCPACMAINKI